MNRIFRHAAAVSLCMALAGAANARFMRTWLFCGPFGKDINTDYIGGEAAAAPAPGKTSGGTPWKAYSSLDNAINLSEGAVFGMHDNANGYAYIEIISETETQARLLLGSDDGMKAWLNGRNIITNDAARPHVAGQDKLVVKLLKGRNRLLVKVKNLGGGWFFSADIKGMDGKNIQGLRFSPEQEDLVRLPVKRIIYSAVQGDDLKQFSPVNTIDGNENTRWSSGFSDEESLTYDYGEEVIINRIALVWENAFASGYSAQVSGDGAAWKDIYSTENGKGGREELKLAGPAAARYLKFSFTKRGTPWGNSLFEVYVYGKKKSEYNPDDYQKTVKAAVLEKAKGVKQPLEFNSYPKQVKAGSTVQVEVEWTRAPSDADYKLLVQLENWDLKPGVCEVVSVDKYEPKGKKVIQVKIPDNAPKVDGYRFVAAFINKMKQWNDAPLVIMTPKDVEVRE